ncbi:MATE efflux family protein [Hyella patelloides LEGE 07179]|uniref:MATE efflux family protein n=1 Tax=Hyella patelloides LEGE 07179 TaxID=945734 RepID=A0A563VIW3_9CYAN|nr:guanitoxin biosynthesis MATE family efflux transporter GntT [Hyella patelloides]VEP11349.1 MATE efflux family protein [Hyella patelloides LEGE 07179]
MNNSFKKRFWQLAAINVVSNLMVPLASLIDTAFLGHLMEIRHLGGVAIATVLFNYIYWTFGFLRMGTTGITAQAVGREDREGIILTLLRNSAIAIAISIVILILQQPLRELGFNLLSADPEVIESGRDYYNALIYGAPATLLNYVLLGWFLGREQGKQVLLLSIVDKSTNIALNYWFIVELGWASRGAATATAISQYLNCLLGFILILREFPLSYLVTFTQKIYEPDALKATFNLNRDILIRTLALVSTFALFTNLSAVMGTITLTANTLILQVVTLGAYFIDGIAFATESIAGNIKGQKNSQLLLPLVKLAIASSIIIGLIMAGVFAFFSQSLFSILTNHTEIIQHLNNYVFWLFPILGFGAIAYILDGYFLGLSAGNILRTSTIIATLFVFLPFACFAWYFQSSHLLWLALSLFMLARAITLGLKVSQTLSIYH